MILIIGGHYQGKRAYALQSLGFSPEDIVGPVNAMIRGTLRNGGDPVAEIADAADGWRGKAVLLTDESCGVVPMEADDRAYREAAGRCGALLAARADKVIRVFCGIGTVIKDA